MTTPSLNTLAKVASEIINREENQSQNLTMSQNTGQMTSSGLHTSSVENAVNEPDLLDRNKPPKKRFRPTQQAPTMSDPNRNFTNTNQPDGVEAAGGAGTAARPVVLRLNPAMVSTWKEMQLFRQLRGIPWEYQGELNGYIPHPAYLDTLGSQTQQVIWSAATCKENTADELKFIETFEVQAAETEVRLAEELSWHISHPSSCRSPTCDCVSDNQKDQSIYERIKASISLFNNPMLRPKVLLGLRGQMEKADKWMQFCKEKQIHFTEKCQSMENDYRRQGLNVQATALIGGQEPLPTNSNIEDWSYCHLLKVRFTYHFLVSWMVNKQITLQNLIAIYQSEMDKEEMSHPLLGFDEQLKAKTRSSTLRRRQETQTQQMKRQAVMFGQVTPPSVFQYYSWTNLKYGNQEFAPAEFQLTSRGPHVTNQFSIPTVIMPVVKQLHQPGDVKGNLYIRYPDVVRVMGLLNYTPKGDLEKAATNVGKMLQSSLRQDIPAGFKCYPLSGNTNFHTLLACHKHEKKIDPAADLPNIVINADVELVDAGKKENFKRYLPIDSHFGLQTRKEVVAGEGMKERDDAFKMLEKVKFDLTNAKVAECTNFVPDEDEMQEARLVHELFSSHPTSTWENECALTAVIWKKIHKHSDGLKGVETITQEETLTTEEINKVIIALTSMFQFIWKFFISEDDHIPITENQNGAVAKPLYGFDNYMRLMSALHSSTVMSQHKQKRRQLQQQWLCAYCAQTEILIKAICQQYSNDYLGYVNAMTTAHQQTNATRHLLNEVTNDVKHIHQMRLNSEFDANRFKAGVAMQNQKVRKITNDRRHAVEDLAVLLCDAILHNVNVPNEHYKLYTHCKSIHIIRKYLQEMDKNNENIPKTHDELVKLIKERLLAGYEFGDPEERNPYIAPLAAKIPPPSTKDVFVNLQGMQNPTNQQQASTLDRMTVEEIHQTTRRACYQGMIDSLPNIYSLELTQLAKLLEHSKDVLIYADRAGVPSQESRKALARRLYGKFKMVPSGQMFERFMTFRNRSNQGKSKQTIHNTAKYLQDLPTDEDSIIQEVENIFAFLEQEVRGQVEAKALQSTSDTDDGVDKTTEPATPPVAEGTFIDVEDIESEEEFIDVTGDSEKEVAKNTSKN